MKQGLPLDLESAISAIDLYDYEKVDWPRVQRSVYLIHQHLRYEYPGPIQDLCQYLMILPPRQHGDQRLIDHRLAVTSLAVETSYRTDAFGNTEIVLRIPAVESAIDFEAWILVERCASRGPHYLPATCLDDEKYLQPSRLTQPDAALRAIAQEFKATGKEGHELATALNAWVYQTMEYAHDITSIATTASEALALKRGVCQDYAHIMVTLCRLCGLPARYVSGHMPGEGGTHAWVEVLLRDEKDPGRVLVLPLDPTHSRPASINYVTVATGNDYFDVAPTSGTYRSAYRGQLSVSKRMDLTTYEYINITDPSAE